MLTNLKALENLFDQSESFGKPWHSSGMEKDLPRLAWKRLAKWLHPYEIGRQFLQHAGLKHSSKTN